ncbi:MAG TPA: protein kinase, partial [Planctomycetota bacterium]|nr:protein kinase [Planctomycetota bacterium]
MGEASERSLTLPPRGYLPQKTLEKAAPTPTLQLPIRVELRLEDSRGDVGEESVAKTALGLRRTADRYRIEAEIGRGGMAVVYRAFDRDLRRQVAMKVMREGFGIDEELTAKFVEEAQTTAQLQHPGIVPVFEIGLNEESRLFFTMKLVRGTTLSEIVSRLRGGDAELRRDYTVFRLLQVFVDIARAVSYAHERGVTHRDLKPQNIMIGRFGEVMVMDWGLAHVIQLERRPGDGGRTGISVSGGRRSQSRGEVWGTAGYMPPEQAIGDKESLGAWSDVFSLGAILYFILTGHAPFEGTYEEQLAQTIAGEPKPARAYEPAVARELDAIARKALQREPKDRYASARALADDVQAFLEGLPVTAHPDNALRRLIKLAQRHRAIARTIAAALFVGLLGATFGIARFERERHLYEQTTHEWHTAEEAARFERERAQRDRARAYAEMGRGALADGDFLSAEVLFAAAVGSDDRQATREGLLEARAHGLRLVWAATDDDHAATIAMSPDGRTVASGGDGCVVRLRDAATGAIKATLKGHRGAVRGLAFSPDGRYLASASDDRTVHIWEVANGFDLATLAGHEGPVYSVAFSPDGRSIATGSDDRAIRIWDTQSGRSLRTLAGHEGLVYGVAWSPDGRRLASGGWDSTVRIWNPATGKEEMRLRSHGGWVYRVAFA